MAHKIRKFARGNGEYPRLLAAIPNPPKQLYAIGADLSSIMDSVCVAIVGSRSVSAYGRYITETFAHDIARQGIAIVSGLALGVDAVAHKAAVAAQGRTIAVLPCGLDRIYPSSNQLLANKIVERGGAIISEYAERTDPRREHFIARNRIVSGLCKGVLITEAAAKSGTLHTANFALEQGREVMAVPGNITSPLSAGTNQLIKTGATSVTDADDVLRCLGLERNSQQEIFAESKEEHIILSLIKHGCLDSDELLQRSGLSPEVFNQTLTLLEITGNIKALGSNSWSL